MEKFQYLTELVCSRQVNFELEDDRVYGVTFYGGCNGNLKAIGKLIEGKTVDEICSLIGGNTCGNKPTSCADQLCKALRKAQAEIAARG